MLNVQYLFGGNSISDMYICCVYQIYGDSTASSKDCFKMFNPTDITTFNVSYTLSFILCNILSFVVCSKKNGTFLYFKNNVTLNLAFYS